MSQIISQNVHRTLKEISDHAKQLVETNTADSSLPQQAVFEEHDKDTLVHDSIAGDEFLFIVNKQGGRLLELNSKANRNMYRLRDSEAQYFHVVLSEQNAGMIEEVVHDLAKDLVSGAVNNPNEHERRMPLYAQLDSILGLKDGDSLVNSRMGHEFQPNALDRSLLRISLVMPNKVAIEVLRINANIDEDHPEHEVQKEAVYYSKVSSEMAEKLKVKNVVMQIDSTQKGYANVSTMKELDFNNALSKLRKKDLGVSQNKAAESTITVDL